MRTRTTSEAFNEWMRRYIESPEQFAREFEAVTLFLAEQSQHKPPTYGEVCTAYLSQLMAEDIGAEFVPALSTTAAE